MSVNALTSRGGRAAYEYKRTTDDSQLLQRSASAAENGVADLPVERAGGVHGLQEVAFV